jgi:hypothetical protein
MTTKHPITPPPELVQQISLHAINAFPDDELGAIEIDEARDEYIANFFTQWGADKELEACCDWLGEQGFLDAYRLHAARRPKPPSLKEEALAKTKALLDDPGRALLVEVRETLELNRRALQAQ